MQTDCPKRERPPEGGWASFPPSSQQTFQQAQENPKDSHQAIQKTLTKEETRRRRPSPVARPSPKRPRQQILHAGQAAPSHRQHQRRASTGATPPGLTRSSSREDRKRVPTFFCSLLEQGNPPPKKGQRALLGPIRAVFRWFVGGTIREGPKRKLVLIRGQP